LWRPHEFARLALLERAIGRRTELSEAERREAQEEAHRLAGTLAYLGRIDACDCAREVERRFDVGPERGDAASLIALVAALRVALDQADDAPPLGSAP
jgi:HPt (histidine-containing phosphotransfer) domain-containing protein